MFSKSSQLIDIVRYLSASEEAYPLAHIDRVAAGMPTQISDCHIRLGLLSGLDLTDSVADLFDTLLAAESEQQHLNLSDIDRKVQSIAASVRQTSGRMSADLLSVLLMAGGTGSRLGHLTTNTPKPLIRVAGRSLLDHSMDQTSTLLIDKLFISVCYLAEKFNKAELEETLNRKITLIREPKPLGTAGSIGFLKDVSFDNLLVLNADVVSGLNHKLFYTFHKILQNDVTIGVTVHKTKIPFGVTQFDGFGQFLKIEEKPTIVHWVSCGVNLISKSAASLVPDTHKIDMPDLIQLVVSAGYRVGVFPIFEDWKDLGTPEALEQFGSSQ